MSNDKLFRALGSPTRIKILKTLSSKEMHLTGLAKEIGISVPVTSRHVDILENVGLITRRVFGNVHLLKTKIRNLEDTLEPFIETSSVSIDKNKSLFDALKQVPGIEVKKVGKNQCIQSIDGDDGYYIYEVNGKLPKKPINEYTINKNVTIDLKKIITVKKKKINLNLNNKK